MTAEDRLQIACVTWFKLQYPHVIIHHSKNEGNRGGKAGLIDGKRNKAMGVCPGFADLFIMQSKIEKLEHYTTIWHGLFIELKVDKNKMTEAQSDFSIAAQIANYRYRVCRSVDEFMNVVNEYLN